MRGLRKMLYKASRRWVAVLWVLSLIVPVWGAPAPVLAAEPPPRRVHAPYFAGNVIYSQTTIFWLGRITPTENYADVRVGYNDEHLYVNVAVIDRRLWYDTSPTPETLTDWDAVSLYLGINDALALDAGTCQFVAQLVSWEPRAGYQQAYCGSSSATWEPATVDFTATTGWRGDRPNNNVDDRGWVARFVIPFTALGLTRAPARGTTWRLGLVVHDRDDAAGTPIPAQVWPETLDPQQPQSWGELIFGRPRPYTSAPATPEGAVTIREGLNGAIVPDAPVGGHTTCGRGVEYWTQWGERNLGQVAYFNIQNQSDISDWPCFSKYYVTFPLDQVPEGRVIQSAEVILHQFGGAGAGWSPPAQPSLIQAFTVAESWDEATLTWNNAPGPAEFAGETWVQPTSVYLGQPGVPWTWDVSAAVASAYAAGEPLRLAFYEADAAYHSGKYFRTSEEEEYGAVGRPTLNITWGDPLATVASASQPAVLLPGDRVTTTLLVQGSGYPLTLGGALGEGFVDAVALTSGLDLTAGSLAWSGAPALGETVALQFAATVTGTTGSLVTYAVTLAQNGEVVDTLNGRFILDPRLFYLPLIARDAP